MNQIKRGLNHYIGENKFHSGLKYNILAKVEKRENKKAFFKVNQLYYASALIAVIFISFILVSDFMPLTISPNKSSDNANLAFGQNDENYNDQDIEDGNDEDFDNDDLDDINESVVESYGPNQLTEEEIAKAEGELVALTEQVFNALKEHDFAKLASYVREGDGLFFSFTADVSFMPVEIFQEELASFTGDEIYLWGMDLADQKFEMPISEYIDEHLMRDDYSFHNYNESYPTGLTFNTIHDHFPNAVFVEYHSPVIEHEWRTWQMLRFVYENVDGEWWLVGIVRDYPEH